jgi:uncharacterized membrane protein
MDVDFQFVLALLFRWLHILAAITAVGGSVFARFVVFPTLEPLPPEQRSALHAAMRNRWARIVAAAIGFLLISGLYNFMITVTQYRVPRWYHMVFGVKFLLAMSIFAIASLLVGKTPAAEALRKNAKLWLNLNIVLAVLVVCLSGVLRTADKTPKKPVPETTAPATSGVRSQKAFCRVARAELVWNEGSRDHGQRAARISFQRFLF